MCALLLWAWPCHAQNADESNPWFVRCGVTAGRIVSTNPFARIGDEGASAITGGQDLALEIGRQTDGSQEWHPLYGMPAYGFGVSLGSFRNDVAHTRPVDAYTFFSWPFLPLTNRFDLTTDFGMGLSWHWNQYSDQTASSRGTLGSDLNAYIDWGFYLRWATTSRTLIYGGIDYTHRSNGGMVQPDQGINTIGPKIAVRYNFAPETPRPPATERLPFEPSWEVIVGGAAGVKSVAEQTTPLLVQQDFGTANATAAAELQFYRFGKIAGGTDLIYDSSVGARIDGANTLERAAVGQRWAVGIYGGYEHVIGRFGAIVQPGYIVARGYDNAGGSRFYTRYGWRYHISDRFYSSVAIRAIGGRIADSLEFGAGYRMPQ